MKYRYDLIRDPINSINLDEAIGIVRDSDNTTDGRVRRLGVALELGVHYPDNYFDGMAPDHPTPLDPSNVYMGALSSSHYIYFDTKQTYEEYALTVSSRHAGDFASGIGADMGSALLMQAELSEQTKNRCAHNAAAFERLKSAMYNSYGQRDLDADLMVAVLRTRSGTASISEQLRLVKEFPEMIAIETSNARSLLTREQTNDFIRLSKIRTAELARNFKDAKVTMSSSEGQVSPSYSASVNVEGVKVVKYVLATIDSATSSTQHILKIAHVPTPSGTFYTPSTYFRASDYKSRPGYEHEAIDEPDADTYDEGYSLIDPNDPTIAALSGEGLQRYLMAMRSAAKRR